MLPPDMPHKHPAVDPQHPADRVQVVGRRLQRDPLIVAGDLNVPRGSWPLDEFLARAGLRDVLAGDRRPTYRPTPAFPTPVALDHVFVRPAPSQDVAVEARLVLQDRVSLPGGRAVHLSDHFGIEAWIRFSD